MEIIPAKGVYLPGEPIKLFLENNNRDTVHITVTSLDAVVEETVIACESEKTEIVLKENYIPEKGYGVVCINDAGESCCTAFDVQNGIRIYRYGFLSDFSPDDAGSTDTECLAKYHINIVQFYDWVYRHDAFLPPSDEYADLMGKKNALSVIKMKIEQCHKRGMKALGYGAVYAAGAEFAEKHPGWRLYAEKGKPLLFIDVFSIMNLRSAWHEHIISEYGKAVHEVGFDGIHMDTYGFPKTAYDEKGNVVHLENDFVELIHDTREQLHDATLIFNNVGAWPLEETMRTEVDAVYIEVWPPFDKYHHLRDLILKAGTSGKPVILAAYPAAFRTDTPKRGLNSQLVLMSAVAANGASQLWYGEENAAITQGYYVDYYKLPKEHEYVLRRYNDFFVRYEELLYDSTLKDVGMTHFGWDNVEYQCSHPCSADGRAGAIWLMIREKPGKKLICMLNLCGDESENWADGRNDVLDQENVVLSVQFFGTIKKIISASPDFEYGNCKGCEYTVLYKKQGPRVDIKIDRIHRFTFVLIETEE